MSTTNVSYVKVDGINVFYRHAGPTGADAPTVLLLHGFPSSSHQFRNLIPLLAPKYRVIAPDLPGYGFTQVPDERKYVYNFANVSTTISAFVDELGLKKFAIYIFDYGAPTGLRLALKTPEKVAAIITQNGNAYVEGFGKPFWTPIEEYWASGEKKEREALKVALKFDTTHWQYTNGNPAADAVQPEAYYLDQALLDRPGNNDIQLDLLYDYRTNIDLYPAFQEYFRKSQVPVLAIWGRNDDIFIAPGAEAFKRDVKNLEFEFLETGHFAIETNEVKVAGLITGFFDKFKVFA